MRLIPLLIVSAFLASCSGHLERAVTDAMRPGAADPIAASAGSVDYRRVIARALVENDRDARSKIFRLSIKTTDAASAEHQADVLHGLAHGIGEDAFAQAVGMEIKPVQDAVWRLLEQRGHTQY